MGDYTEVRVIIDTPLISNLHETITSILQQVDKDRLNLHVIIDNQTNLKIDREQQRLLDYNIKLTDNPTDARFVLTLKSGDIISRSFLYKGTHFLKSNPASFVCPEYTFRRIENAPTIATISNNKMLCNKTSFNLFDRKKTLNCLDNSPRADVIKDTCAAKSTVNTNIFDYLESIKSEAPFFNSPLFSHLNTQTTHILPPPNCINKPQRTKNRLLSVLKSIIKNNRIVKKIFSPNNLSDLDSRMPPYISDHMHEEIEQLSSIKYGLKGYESMQFLDLTQETFSQSEELFKLYHSVLKQLDDKNYFYMMVLPWLIHGGVDLFATNYLRTISELLPDQNILVFLTNGAHDSLTHEELNLPSNVTIVDLPKLFKPDITCSTLYPQLLYSFINTLRPERVHIIASKAGYDCIEEYGNAIRDNGSKILFSSYNYLTSPHGEYTGYTVQELPLSYRPGDTITTDNIVSRNLWINHYGFTPNDILIHHQLFDYDINSMPSPSTKNGIRILWAAHIRPEKNPGIVPIIAKSLENDNIEIDCYGLFSAMNWPDGKNPLNTSIPNLHYKGAYNDFFNDINLSQYDLFLYTSYSDGTPNVVIEAALAGLPIVSSNIGGISKA